MTTPAENEFLTRIGPGTPMGALLRQYWVPACLSSELVADGDPLRLMLLGEKLVAFRDSTGRIGIFDHRCPHRCASLFFGRNEEGGLRCAYHGWKFDTQGNCLDMPNVPPPLDLRGQVKARAYRAAERNGLVYVYMGERATAPPLPALEALLSPPDETALFCRQRECNWLQALEGDVDTAHFTFLHAGKVEPHEVDPDHMERFQLMERAAQYQVTSADWGTMYAACRAAQPGQTYYRYAHFVMPFWTLFPNGPIAGNILAQGWVPMDDSHTMVFTLMWKGATPPLLNKLDGSQIPHLFRESPMRPNTTDWFGRWRTVASAENDYLIDREMQRTVSYSGISGLFPQDSAMTESGDTIADRTLEHLVPSDRMIVMTRRRLYEAAWALRGHGTVPPLVDDPETAARVRSGEIVAPADRDWLELYEEALAGVRRPPLPRAAE
ncbi:MAG TPA: Rieske 2Fe-2S domain-containing protein [Stellaceae bacterium]|nr:Rieske 2Fe-2S domain-containing protein [Stellaceae bacterium]